MTSRTSTEGIARLSDIPIPDEGPLTPQQGVEAFRRAVAEGREWYPALLEVIARWVAPEEEVDGVRLHYLIAGEAFDWLLLAQRLLEAAGELVPEAEAEKLVVEGVAPRNETEEEFEAAIGPAKYRAHLNFQYGVVIEELLLLAAEQELNKTGRLSGHGMPPADVLAFERVYGKTFDELKVLYQSEEGVTLGDRVSQTDMRLMLYWLSKFRIRYAEPARIASDTRKAMTVLAGMEGRRARLARLREAEARREALG